MADITHIKSDIKTKRGSTISPSSLNQNRFANVAKRFASDTEYNRLWIIVCSCVHDYRRDIGSGYEQAIYTSLLKETNLRTPLLTIRTVRKRIVSLSLSIPTKIVPIVTEWKSLHFFNL